MAFCLNENKCHLKNQAQGMHDKNIRPKPVPKSRDNQQKISGNRTGMRGQELHQPARCCDLLVFLVKNQ